MSFRPLRETVLIQVDPAPTMRGAIVLPDDAEPRIRTGVVLSVGPGRWVGKKKKTRERIGVEPGERVAFLQMHMDTPSGAQLTETIRQLGDNIGLLADRDILFAMPANEPIPTLE